jgi:hypothetical protein
LVYLLPAIIIAGILKRGLTAAGLKTGIGLGFLLSDDGCVLRQQIEVKHANANIH